MATSSSTTIDDIEETVSETAADLKSQADAVLRKAEKATTEHTESLRRAVREDLENGRDWANARTKQARDAIRDEPIRTTAYAIGIGVLIGLLLRR